MKDLELMFAIVLVQSRHRVTQVEFRRTTSFLCQHHTSQSATRKQRWQQVTAH